jgi:hypothetical protein
MSSVRSAFPGLSVDVRRYRSPVQGSDGNPNVSGVVISVWRSFPGSIFSPAPQGAVSNKLVTKAIPLNALTLYKPTSATIAKVSFAACFVVGGYAFGSGWLLAKAQPAKSKPSTEPAVG